MLRVRLGRFGVSGFPRCFDAHTRQIPGEVYRRDRAVGLRFEVRGLASKKHPKSLLSLSLSVPLPPSTTAPIE